MSLINEALKKAERARAGSTGEAPAPAAAPMIAKRRRTIGTRTLLGLGITFVLMIIGGASALLFRTGEEAPKAPAPARPAIAAKSEAPKAAETQPAVAAPANTPAAPASPPPPAPVAPSAPLPAVPASPAVAAPAAAAAPVPATPAIASAPPPPPPPPSPTTPLPAAPVVAPSAPPATPAAPAMPRVDERIADHVDRLRILGVRSPGPDARVLIGERVYRLNDVVDRSLGLRLVKVEPGTLTFADATGSLYKKNY